MGGILENHSVKAVKTSSFHNEFLDTTEVVFRVILIQRKVVVMESGNPKNVVCFKEISVKKKIV